MRYLYIILLCLLLQKTYAQQQFNLVPNFSFEDSVICPGGTASNPLPKPWYIPSNYKIGQYLNACSSQPYAAVPYNVLGGGFQSYQVAKSGNGYAWISAYTDASFIENFRQYIQIKLKNGLIGGRYYSCEFWVSLTNPSNYAINNMAMLLTNNAKYVDTLTSSNEVINANPQIVNYGNPIIIDTMNWVKVSGIYKAVGGEKYITIGNFRNDAQTNIQQIQTLGAAGAGYYIDDVSVIPLDSFCLKADAGKDTAISLGDSVFIGSYTNGLDSVKWLNGNTVIDSLRPGFWVKPTTTTSYILQQAVNGCFSADTVVLTVGTVPLKILNYELRMLNDKQIQNIWQTANEVNVSHFNIQRSTNGKEFITIGTQKAQNNSSNEYKFMDNSQQSTADGSLSTIYYRIESIDNDGKKQYSETRTLNLKPQTLNGISIYPNPAKDAVNISLKEKIKEICVVNQLGQVMQQTQVNKEQLKLNVSYISNGLYLLKITTQTNVVYHEKFIKQ